MARDGGNHLCVCMRLGIQGDAVFASGHEEQCRAQESFRCRDDGQSFASHGVKGLAFGHGDCLLIHLNLDYAVERGYARLIGRKRLDNELGTLDRGIEGRRANNVAIAFREDLVNHAADLATMHEELDLRIFVVARQLSQLHMGARPNHRDLERKELDRGCAIRGNQLITA